MKRARTVTGWLLVGLLGGAVAQGCGSSTSPKRNPGSGATSGSSGKDAGSMTVEPPGNGGNGGESQYDPLCGIPDTNFCVPDFETNSLCVEGVGGSGGSSGRGAGARGGSSSGTGGSGGSGATSTTGGAPAATGGSVSALAGAGGESGSEGGVSQGGVSATAGESATNGAQSGQGGETQSSAGQPTFGGGAGEPGTGGGVVMSGTGGTAGQASAGRAGGTELTASISCQVVESPNHKGAPLATCRPAGSGTEGSPCFSGADCAPTFACVGDGPGQCRAYCCSGPEQCQAHTGTHCAVEPLVPDAKSTRVHDVPVCMPAVKCSLAESHPCSAGVTCSCPERSACMVVSDDGTTSCVPDSELPPEGMGVLGLPCPCAFGFVCSQANKCVKLCEVAAMGCDSGRCQASASLPAGWGTCIGVAPKDSTP